MKKVMLFILCLVMFPCFLDASECTYSEKRELNALASYVDYVFDYDESKNSFTVTLMNINDRIEVRYENDKLDANNGEVVIKDLGEGMQIQADIYSNVSNECYNEYLRAIYISIPYVNTFYGSSLCEGNEDLVVCHSEFLDYKISYKTFIKLINREELIQEEEKQEQIINEKEMTFGEKFLSFLQEYWLKFVVFVISSLITYGVFSPIYRKVKHRL